MVFCNDSEDYQKGQKKVVTILILIDGFLQSNQKGDTKMNDESQSLF